MKLYAENMTRPFDSFNESARGPVVLTVTHAGRDYPEELAERLAVPFDRARPLEDRFADRLVDSAIAQGFHTLVARTPRLMIDLNRAETDFVARAVPGTRAPVARPSHRARGGLGLVPERLGNVPLWRTPVRAHDLAERIVAVHRPWHRAVEAALVQACALNARALLIDVHSMPTLTGAYPAQVVIGDGHGASASPDDTDLAVEVFKEAGLRVAVNAPYAGAYMLERHGRPARGISALQIEIDRRLYLDSALDGPGKGLAAMQGLIATLAHRLGTVEGSKIWPLAAE
jgi:N-formylglutamate amidohydrolase